jgi:hypothetical protein
LKRFDWLKLSSVEFELANQRAILKERKERTFPITNRYHYYKISNSTFLPMHWSVLGAEALINKLVNNNYSSLTARVLIKGNSVLVE